MEAIAHALTDGGSFYPSIHLAWHFEEVDLEVTRPIYMTASIMQDYFKGGWAAPWESTGGPQQLSGHKGQYPEIAQRPAAFTVDGGVLSQFLMSYFGAGMKGFGLWCWSARTAGWEAGEFALLDRNNRPSSRVQAAGAIARAANRLRDELWLARKEPIVGVFTDFENDAMWAAVSSHERTL
jgi:beta-galactosidase